MWAHNDFVLTSDNIFLSLINEIVIKLHVFPDHKFTVYICVCVDYVSPYCT